MDLNLNLNLNLNYRRNVSSDVKLFLHFCILFVQNNRIELLIMQEVFNDASRSFRIINSFFFEFKYFRTDELSDKRLQCYFKVNCCSNQFVLASYVFPHEQIFNFLKGNDLLVINRPQKFFPCMQFL